MSFDGKLKFKNFEDLKTASNFDFQKMDFTKRKVCDSLSKIYDEGMKKKKEGDNETAYCFLMRFTEGVMKLRKSNLYKTDKDYVDAFISTKRLMDTITLLEKLTGELKNIYQLNSIPAPQTPLPTLATTNFQENKNSTNQIKTLVQNEKKYASPKELVEMINKLDLKILLIDTRSKNEFLNSQINFNILLNTNKRNSENVSYINIPHEIIDNVPWKIYDELKKSNDSTTAQIFSNRINYDKTILFDKSTEYKNLLQNSQIAILKRALFEFDIENRLKSEPIVLDGGFDNWLLYYPGYTTNASPISNSMNELKLSESKDNLRKVFDINFPDLEPKPKPAVEPVQNIHPQAQTKNDSNDMNSQNSIHIEILKDPEIKPEPILNDNLIDLRSAKNSQQISSNPPSVNRSNKPVKDFRDNKENDEPKIPLDLKSNTSESQIVNTYTEKDAFNNSKNDSNSNTIVPSICINKPKLDNIFKPSLPQSLLRNDPVVNNAVFNSVYVPARYNQPVHTPFMQEGTSKILNSNTGIFSYVPGSTATFTASTLHKPSDTKKQKTTIESNTFKSPVFKKPTPPSASSSAFTPTGSNLKRTISSPNIAKLDDSEDENLKTITNKNKTESKELHNQIKPLINTVIRAPLPMPNVNRSSKPVPEHITRSRLEDLQPVFGNVNPGLTGIKNLGNTCFMNSIIQCLISTKQLASYFYSEKYKNDLNRENHLGFKGQIADEFALIVKSMWGGICKIISPRRFKTLIGQFNQQFLSNDQQDAQELLLFLLDGLHEDLNRVLKRPRIIANNDDDDDKNRMPDADAANLAWSSHLSINSSIIVDLFQVIFAIFIILQVFF
jgi:ubiquitin carboxyl-terminal hydrolase 8